MHLKWSWPCFWSSGSRGSSDEDDLDPVLLVSGLGGSILNSKKKSKLGFESRVWVRIFLADLEFKKRLWSLYNPTTGYTEPLDDSSEIVVPEDDYGLYAIDVLDPTMVTKCVHVSEVYYFHEMIDMLVDCGYKKGTTLFGFGYDFRQSNRIGKSMDGFKAKLETAYKASGGRKVFCKYVNKWICIACPFQGAPGCINDSLLTGLQFLEGFESYFFVLRWTMHQLLIECPSFYEMLPNPKFDWENTPEIQVWRKQSQDDTAELKSYGPTKSITVFEEALKNNELKYDGKKIALPFNLSIFKWACATRQILDNAQLPDGVSFYNIYGTSFDTPFNVCYGSEDSPIEDWSNICHTIPQYSYVDGDGTVPTESAKGDWFDATERVGVASSHRELLCNKRVFELIQTWLGLNPKNAKNHSRTSRVIGVPSP